jgi:hypothetical protein
MQLDWPARMTCIAVLTGDIIRSRDLDLEDVFFYISEAAELIAGWQNNSPKLTRFRGDGWQMFLTRPTFGLRAALAIRAAIRGSGSGRDTRISIAEGEGTIDDSPNLAAASGHAFVASGQSLDNMKRPFTMTHASGGTMGAATVLADRISSKSIELMLHPELRNRTQVAKAIGKSRQSVDQALASAGFTAIEQALRLIESGAR